jgi:hypothetical protein
MRKGFELCFGDASGRDGGFDCRLYKANWGKFMSKLNRFLPLLWLVPDEDYWLRIVPADIDPTNCDPVHTLLDWFTNVCKLVRIPPDLPSAVGYFLDLPRPSPVRDSACDSMSMPLYLPIAIRRDVLSGGRENSEIQEEDFDSFFKALATSRKRGILMVAPGQGRGTRDASGGFGSGFTGRDDQDLTAVQTEWMPFVYMCD